MGLADRAGGKIVENVSRELGRLQPVQFLPDFFQPVLPALVLRPSICVVYFASLPIQSIRLEYSVYFILKGLDSSFPGFCHRQRSCGDYSAGGGDINTAFWVLMRSVNLQRGD
jgi:hypothetical protein